MRSFRFWSLARSHWTFGKHAVPSRTFLPHSLSGARSANEPVLTRSLLPSFPPLNSVRTSNIQCLNAMSLASNLCMSLVGLTAARSMILPLSIHLQNGFQVRWSRATKNPKWWKTKPGLGKPAGKKLKTHKGAKKRFMVTRMGKVGYMPTGKQHLNYGMSSRKRAELRKRRYLSPTQAKIIRKLLLVDRRPRNIYVPQSEPLKLRETPLNDEDWEVMKAKIERRKK